MFAVSPAQQDKIMPNVAGKKYPYTKKGKAAAKKAAMKQSKKVKMKSK